MKVFNRLLRQRESMLVMVNLLIVVFLMFASPVFFSLGNFTAIMISLSIEAIIAVAMTNLLISGGFDMSVGSVACFSGMLAAYLWKMASFPPILAIILGIVSGGLIGIFNGVLVAKIKITPFVVTLASLNIFRGIVYAITQGKSIAGLPREFRLLGQSDIAGIQMPIIIAIILVIIGHFLLKHWRFFRQNYYIGGNEKAALLSGINVSRMKIINYMLTGLFAGFAGVVQAGRLGAAMSTTGEGLEMKVLTAVIIGGASLQGGEGTIIGTFLGSILMALVTNGINLIGVNVYWQTFIVGITLLIAVIIDSYGKLRRDKILVNKIKDCSQKIEG